MENITVIGWYGTETIGDRAIFSGLLRVFSECFNSFSVNIGSIYPHFTQRTLLEDYDFYNEISQKKIGNIKIFDSLDVDLLKKHIKESSILVIGGGPLMDIQYMNMLEYAFKYAKKNNTRSFALGCGWGPLKQVKYIKTALNILNNADLVIFRDQDSLNSYFEYSKHYNAISLIDPAFFAADYFINTYPCVNTSNYIAINFRDLYADGLIDSSNNELNKFSNIVKQFMDKYPDSEIKLIPMHTFYVGGDDRIILEKIKSTLNSEQIEVSHKPYSLRETMEIYRDAYLCVGMRFHSIVIQLVVNGYNFILDYTDPQKGKTIGMLRQLKINNMLNNRYIKISDENIYNLNDERKKITLQQSMIDSYFLQYIHCIKKSL